MFKNEKQPLYFALFLAFISIILSLFYRPMFPIDETRYISVAWEMWQNSNWLVPMKNGEVYAHKPPGLFWLINLSWYIFGVSEAAARLTVPLIACANYILIMKLAKLVYPNSAQAKAYSPIVLVSLFGWFLYVPLTMFDLLLTVFILSAFINLYKFFRTGRTLYATFSGISLGLGMLIKGPVALVYILPMMLTFNYWRDNSMINSRRAYSGSFLAFIIGVIIVLCWAIPAALSGGKEYANAIFWDQSVGRMKNSFAHALPFYWYLELLPFLLMPWLLMKQLWSSKIKNPVKTCLGNKFSLIIFCSVVIIFSCFSGKRIHYLFPIFPIAAIFIANNISINTKKKETYLALLLAFIAFAIFSVNYWLKLVFKNASGVADYDLNYIWGLVPLIGSLILLNMQFITNKIKINPLAFTLFTTSFGMFTLIPFLSPVIFQFYDVSPTAKYIHQLQNDGINVLFDGKYRNQYQFLGRLEKPLGKINYRKLNDSPQTIDEHKVVVLTKKHISDADKENSLFITPYRGRFQLIKLLDKQVATDGK